MGLRCYDHVQLDYRYKKNGKKGSPNRLKKEPLEGNHIVQKKKVIAVNLEGREETICGIQKRTWLSMQRI